MKFVDGCKIRLVLLGVVVGLVLCPSGAAHGDYLVVDDFDSYTDHWAIKTVWKDYYTGTGAEVFVETNPALVRDGKSMMYLFRNFFSTAGRFVGSEAEADIADLEIGTDWTAGEALVLYFYGDPGNLTDTTGVYEGIHQDQMYVALEDGGSNVGIVKYPDMNAIKEASWHEWNIELADPCLTAVDMNNVVKVYIGFGGQKMGQTKYGAGDKTGIGDTVWFDDIQLWVPPVTKKLLYVDADATGADDGSSWGDAYNYLQDALAAAISGDEIWVAEGIYKPDEGGNNMPGDREATFQLINGVAIKGGYAGFGAPEPDTRDVEAYESILSGEIGTSDVSDNSYHVVVGADVNGTAVLDGFTIRGGNANGLGSRYGGGIYFSYSSATVKNCTFEDNRASWGGGAVGAYNLSQPTMLNCVFRNNRVVGQGMNPGYGGGISTFYTNPTLINCIFVGNSAGNGGGMGNYNGSQPKLVNCLFFDNTASSDGGAIKNHNGYPELTNCTLVGNRASKGGGIQDFYSRSILRNCVLWANSDNAGTGQRSQIYKNSGVPVVSYCCIQGWTGSWGGVGNIGGDPLFVNQDSGNCHLRADSPCIDAGNPNYVAEPNETDLNGNPRVFGDKIDMGAYEFYPNTVPNACIVGGDQTIGVGSGCEARVILDGSCSSDADSTPGTNDDINDFDWYVVDACDPNYEDYLGSGEIIECNLPLGKNYVILVVTAKSGEEGFDQSTIGVFDTTGPVLQCPNDMIVEATCPEGAIVNFTVTATDLVDTSPEISCSPPSGSMFPLGTTKVSCSAKDSSGNWAAPSVFYVTVQDAAPPEITCPADVTVEQESYAGTVVALEATATDNCDTNPVITSDELAIYPLGVTIVTFTATDASGNSASCSMTVTVVDTTPPVITLNGDATMTLECGIDSYTEEGATATDLCDGDVPVVIGGDTVDTSTCGTYVVTYDATDDSGNSAAQVTRTVIVEDTIPPEFSLSVEPNVLWPANHKMVKITPSWTVSDNCDESPDVTLVSITMNEEDDAKGDGHTSDDIQISANGSIYLRAERSGKGSGRVYTITYRAVDDAGNVVVDSATVKVPHDRR